MKSLRIFGPNDARVVTDAPIPSLKKPTDVLVKVIAVALNPTDWKHIRFGAAPATVGCDFSGIVMEVGSGVTEHKKGDRIFGSVHGSNHLWPENGAFAEYLVANIVMKIPKGKSFEEAATAGVALNTVGQGLYQEMELPWPESKEAEAALKEGAEKGKILIWGGSSAMGAMGIQFAKLSGFEVITTASKSNFDYVKSLGADAVFDSRSPTTGTEIRAYTNDKLYYAWDTLGEHGAPQGCAEALASSPPASHPFRYGTIMAFPGQAPPRQDVKYSMSLAYTATGENIMTMGFQFPAIPSHYEFAVKWAKVAEKLYGEGKLQTHRLDVREGGIDKILEGLGDMREGKVSGKKIVYRVAEP
ncbi:putative zinc-binding oxidoreductase ToxD [Massarina eburnea CBS 473.64]|uniref:Putative zinc-binding oxidoreductase ToxD n=1 Tax=Massarina eburnea CBS 473.64 TaxID=1395130 RepID=A0A6A6S0Q6_9PLEO|nr:putative zinc-binding oxidoreductase ToxD [Massarina eburnea CBS 473.64]